MRFFRTLLFSVRGLCRRPHNIEKISIFTLVVVVLVAAAHVLSQISENMVLAFFARWLWIPLSLLYLIGIHGEILARHQYRVFFECRKMMGFDGKLPTYIKVTSLNRYLKKVSFKSRVPLCEWIKNVPDLEMLHKKRVYKIESLEEDITAVNIYVIEELLPEYIEWQDDFMQDGRKFAIGIGYMGQEVWDASVLAHGIVAGATGGGKSALLRCIIHQAIHKKYNVQVFDFKQGGDFVQSEQEYAKYKDLEAGYGPMVISEPGEARNVLVSLLVEARYRLAQFKKASVTNIDEYNALGGEQFLPWLLVIDEAAEVLDVKPKEKVEKELYTEIDQTLRTLARISRAAGVHILLGIIRPSSEILDGQIKNNLLWRVCGYFADSAASRIVLENDRATELPSNVKGRFIIGENEVQAYYLPMPKSSNNGLGR